MHRILFYRKFFTVIVQTYNIIIITDMEIELSKKKTLPWYKSNRKSFLMASKTLMVSFEMHNHIIISHPNPGEDPASQPMPHRQKVPSSDSCSQCAYPLRLSVSRFDVCGVDVAAAGAGAALMGLEAVVVGGSNSRGVVVDCGSCIQEGHNGR